MRPLDTPLTTVARLAAIAGLRAGPQDLPASARLLAALAVVDALIGMLSLRGSMPVGHAWAVAAMSIGLSLLFTALLLYLRGLIGRFWQTAAALIGVDVLISLVTLPLALALTRQGGADGALAGSPALAVSLLAILAWNIAVVANIFRHALGFTRMAAVMVGLAYVFLTTGIAF